MTCARLLTGLLALLVLAPAFSKEENAYEELEQWVIDNGGWVGFQVRCLAP